MKNQRMQCLHISKCLVNNVKGTRGCEFLQPNTSLFAIENVRTSRAHLFQAKIRTAPFWSSSEYSWPVPKTKATRTWLRRRANIISTTSMIMATQKSALTLSFRVVQCRKLIGDSISCIHHWQSLAARYLADSLYLIIKGRNATV